MSPGGSAPASVVRQAGVSAGFGRRFAALLYDGLLLAGLLIAYTGLALFFTHGKAVVSETVGGWVWLYRTGLVAVISSYYLVNWTRSGQTLGMRAWHLRAVSAAGMPLTFKSALLRLLLGAIAWAPAALGVLWLYLDRERLALQDRGSGTRVVRLERRGRTETPP